MERVWMKRLEVGFTAMMRRDLDLRRVKIRNAEVSEIRTSNLKQ